MAKPRQADHDERLTDYLDGRMDEQDRRSLERELQDDPELATALEHYRLIGQTLRQLPAGQAPKELADRVQQQIADVSSSAGDADDKHGVTGTTKLHAAQDDTSQVDSLNRDAEDRRTQNDKEHQDDRRTRHRRLFWIAAVAATAALLLVTQNPDVHIAQGPAPETPDANRDENRAVALKESLPDDVSSTQQPPTSADDRAAPAAPATTANNLPQLETAPLPQQETAPPPQQETAPPPQLPNVIRSQKRGRAGGRQDTFSRRAWQAAEANETGQPMALLAEASQPQYASLLKHLDSKEIRYQSEEFDAGRFDQPGTKSLFYQHFESLPDHPSTSNGRGTSKGTVHRITISQSPAQVIDLLKSMPRQNLAEADKDSQPAHPQQTPPNASTSTDAFFGIGVEALSTADPEEAASQTKTERTEPTQTILFLKVRNDSK